MNNHEFNEMIVEMLLAEVEGVKFYGDRQPELWLAKFENFKKIVENQMNPDKED